jgi:hypothetical protein
MMDGRVNSIREMLDSNGYQSTALMAYSANTAHPFTDHLGMLQVAHLSLEIGAVTRWI